jgi:apolipoprotein N-acyltransferase
MYQETTSTVHFAFRDGTTVYTDYGDWFAWSCLAAALFALVWSQRPNYSPRRKPPAPPTHDGSPERRRP